MSLARDVAEGNWLGSLLSEALLEDYSLERDKSVPRAKQDDPDN